MSKSIISTHIPESTKKQAKQANLPRIPEDLIIFPKIMVSQKSGEDVIEMMENPLPPTNAMKALFQDDIALFPLPPQ